MGLRDILYVLTVFLVAMTLAKDSVIPSAELGLLNFVSRSANLMQHNQKRSMSCVDYYMPLINDCIRQYEKNNNLCSSNAQKARNDTEAATVEKQVELSNKTKTACGAVNQCGNGAKATTTFQCYADESSKGSKALQGISNDATVQLASFNEAIRRIDSNEQMCITDNRIQYEKDSVVLYEQFTNCIYGVTQVPTTLHSRV